jgi:hypothetical protein
MPANHEDEDEDGPLELASIVAAFVFFAVGWPLAALAGFGPGGETFGVVGAAIVGLAAGVWCYRRERGRRNV